jgi:hypothetical protein
LGLLGFHGQGAISGNFQQLGQPEESLSSLTIVSELTCHVKLIVGISSWIKLKQLNEFEARVGVCLSTKQRLDELELAQKDGQCRWRRRLLTKRCHLRIQPPCFQKRSLKPY